MYLFDRCIHWKFIGFFLCFTEDNGSAMAATIDLDHITYHSCALWPVARYGQMLPEGESAKPRKKMRDIFINSTSHSSLVESLNFHLCWWWKMQQFLFQMNFLAFPNGDIQLSVITWTLAPYIILHIYFTKICHLPCRNNNNFMHLHLSHDYLVEWLCL